MTTPPPPEDGSPRVAARRGRFAWRPTLRAFHRDLGYLAVGLTVIYAISGLAVNHIADWDPNFRNYRTVSELGTGLPRDADAAATEALRRLKIRERATGVYRAGPEQLEIRVGERLISVNPVTGRAVEQGRKPRALVRLANWLHLNRGKRAWTIIADLYAVGLLCLAITGIFMLPGKKGIAGRGAVLVLLGIAIPIIYVLISGGPGGR